MSERISTKDIRAMDPGSRIETTLLVRKSSQRETKAGSPYVALTLGDEFGDLEGRAWSTDLGGEGPPAPGTVLTVGGKVSEWRGETQISVDHWTVKQDQDLSGLVPSAHLPGERLWQMVRDDIEKLCEGDVKKLTLYVLDALKDKLVAYPAAQGHHHARLSGLIQHISSMLELLHRVEVTYRPRYERELDTSIVAAAIVFHDLGKVLELSGPVGTEYTDVGRAVGHIAMGVQMLESAQLVSRVSLDEHEVTHLNHLILSHHGKKEWGSPVEPCTPEAILLHQLDMMDSRMDAALTAAASAGEGDRWVSMGHGDLFVGRFGVEGGSDE